MMDGMLEGDDDGDDKKMYESYVSTIKCNMS